MKIATSLVIAMLLHVACLSAQAPGPPNPGRGSYSNADQAAPLPGPEAKPPLSSPATARVRLSGKKLAVQYSSPKMRGRAIMGSLVPYGKVWRTGADAATTFTTSADLMIEGTRIPAGTYSLYTLPAEPDSGELWKLIINRQIGQWGTVYDPGRDLTRLPMRSSPLASPQEAMTISFKKVDETSVEMHVKWATADEFVTITLAP